MMQQYNLQSYLQVIWQQHTYVLEKAPAFGFGIAVSGGVDNPAARTGDTSVIISDVVKGGPAWDKLQVRKLIKTTLFFGPFFN